MFNSHGDDPRATPFRAHQTMGQGQEFDTIRMLMARWGDLAVDIGDDAAVLPRLTHGHRVVSTDACVEGVHFLSHWITPYEVGGRAAAAALSDLAAMGAAAECVLVAFVVPTAWRASLGDVADGIGAQVARAGARIVGGNISRGETFGITLTVIGRAERPVARTGARVGELVVVTGTLGGPGAAIGAWREHDTPTAWARDRFAAPVPRLTEGQLLAAAGVSAMMDISDGLAADARHLGAASGVTLTIDPARLPVGQGISVQEALASGEEYELLATMPKAAYEALAGRWTAQTALPLTVVGHVAPEGSSGLPGANGHDHFA